MKRFCLALLFSLLISAASAQLSGGLMFPGPGTAHSAGGGGLAIDGSDVHVNATAASPTATISTSGTNRVLLAFIVTNGGPITSVTSSGLTWTKAGATTTEIELWSAVAASQVTGHVVTVNNTTSAFTTIDLFAISGANITTPFDGAATVNNGVDPCSYTTTHANAVVIAGFRFGGTASPTAGSGWTQLSGADFQLAEYQIVSATGTYSATVTTGVGASNGSICAAIVQ